MNLHIVSGTSTDLDDVMYTIKNQNFIEPVLLSNRFWDMFIVDAFLGNFDRHNGNWGFLVDGETGQTTVAPVFDCGSCLLSQADDNIMAQLLDNEDELNARIFTFPTSAIRQDGQKLNYYDFLTSTDIKECHDALQRIVPRIDLEKINDFIDRLMELRQFKTSFTSTILKHAMIKFYFLLTRYL